MSDVIDARGIYCIETVWYATTSNLSIRPMLDLMHAYHGTPFVHRNAVSREEFFYFLDAWLDASYGEEQFPLLVLSYHGLQGAVVLRDDEYIDLEDEDTFAEYVVGLDEIAEKIEGRCRNKVIHFASCSSVDVNTNEIADFIEGSGVSAVSGYTAKVPWMDSAAFDMLYLHSVQTAKFKYLTPRLMADVNDALREAPYTELGEDLGFNMRVRSQPARN